VLLRCGFSFFY